MNFEHIYEAKSLQHIDGNRFSAVVSLGFDMYKDLEFVLYGSEGISSQNVQQFFQNVVSTTKVLIKVDERDDAVYCDVSYFWGNEWRNFTKDLLELED